MYATTQILVLISELVVFLMIYGVGPVAGMWTLLLLLAGLPLYVALRKD
jgi:hypothetical protein